MNIEFAEISRPDEDVRDDVLRRHNKLGALAQLGAWIAACQGQWPARPLRRPRVVVFAAEHGIAAKAVSARPVEATRELLTALSCGTHPVSILAADTGASVRVVDAGVNAATPESTASENTAPTDTEPTDTEPADRKAADGTIRTGTGSIDTEDALSPDQTVTAVQNGMRIADAEADAGTDLLIPAVIGVGASTPATTLVAALTGTEPVAVTGWGSGIDDNTWMRKVTAVRDALWRTRPVRMQPLALLSTAGGADLAALTGFLAQAAARRTPLLLDGLCVSASALLAEELAPGTRSWCTAAHRTPEPAEALALEHLGLEPLVDLGMTGDGGIGATAILPLLSAAIRLTSS